MSKARRAVYIQLAALAIAVALVGFLSWFFPIAEVVQRAQAAVMHWGRWSAVAYPLLFALCNLMLLPGGVLSVGSGFLFGLWWGFLIVFAGNSLAAALAFALSRCLGRRWFGRYIAQSHTFAKLEPAVEREGWKVIGLSQLHPLFPASLLDYLYGLTEIKFRTYIVWTSLGPAPGLFVYAYFGTLGQLGLNVALGKTHPRVIACLMWGGAFVTSAPLFVLLTRLALEAIHTCEARTARRHSREAISA